MKAETVLVYKLDHTGRTVWTYPADVIERTDSRIILKAEFDRERVKIGSITLLAGDHFLEYFYTDRWYNIFQIRDAESKRIKGWYCNITRPAVLESGSVKAEDLALDLVVYPDGSHELLDEDEYEALELDSVEGDQVQKAVQTLLQMVKTNSPPFERTAPPA